MKIVERIIFITFTGLRNNIPNNSLDGFGLNIRFYNLYIMQTRIIRNIIHLKNTDLSFGRDVYRRMNKYVPPLYTSRPVADWGWTIAVIIHRISAEILRMQSVWIYTWGYFILFLPVSRRHTTAKKINNILIIIQTRKIGLYYCNYR